MKYVKLTLDFNYEKYSQHETDSLNAHTKNKVYYSLGKFYIYVDADKIDFGKNKLGKALDKRTTKTLKAL